MLAVRAIVHVVIDYGITTKKKHRSGGKPGPEDGGAAGIDTTAPRSFLTDSSSQTFKQSQDSSICLLPTQVQFEELDELTAIPSTQITVN